MPESTDLSEGPLAFEIAFSNTGRQEAFETGVEVEIFRQYMEQGWPAEEKIESASKAFSYGGLKPGETRAERIIVPLNENGDFKAKIRASGLEAGFEEKNIEFATTGAAGQCYALYCDQPSPITGQCKARCYCENCLFGSACAEQILQSDNITLGLSPDVTFWGLEPEIMGNGIVDFALESDYCN
jgi:hypothetical protein